MSTHHAQRDDLIYKPTNKLSKEAFDRRPVSCNHYVIIGNDVVKETHGKATFQELYGCLFQQGEDY